MILSILIPSIPERRDKLVPLLNDLYKQILALHSLHPSLGSVEILVDDSIRFLDGGLSIGGKRDLLKQRAAGKYLCFIDDDDQVTPNYIEQLVRLCGEDKDIVTFRALVKNDHYWSLIDMSLNNEVNTEVNPTSIIPRTPWHICPVKSEHAKSESFNPKLIHNDDWDWMERVLKRVKTESHTDMILTQYNHSESGSEADKIFGEKQELIKRTVLISLAIDGREKYTEKSINLERSIAEYWRIYDTRLYKSYPDFVTPHEVIPYKFKYDLIKRAKDEGYSYVIWLDSSIRMASGTLHSYFGEMGIMAFDNLGHPLYKYISDKALKNLKVSEADLKKIPQTWGGAIGFDFTKDKACQIFEEIYAQSFNGSFETAGSTRKDFVAHRHDQACLSVILWKHKYKLLPYGLIAAKADVTDKTIFQYGD